ncbi:Transcription factor [Neofusicoccum parvum]|uniref:Transcription factor n=1 Tax=Neofusicoccum parvum TaxID=310453 RepID=A0ACB5RU14_9PEZI|nr:Transcription factor [Neofusicoccum parvum]
MPRRLSTAHSAGSLDSHTATSQEKAKDASPYGSKLTVVESNGLRKRSHSLGSKDEPFPKKRQIDPGISPLETIRPMSTPQSPSTIEAQFYIQQELDATKDLSSTRRTVLKSAMEFISQLSERPKVTIGARTGFSCSGTALQDIHYPTIEFLYWMLREINSNSMGFHVSYFMKHVSPKSLERMGVALLHQQEDQETLLLYSICVNSMAAKFLNTILLEETNDDMAQEVRTATEKYRTSAQLAMSRIHLLASPSLTLLQALLCSAFISQGAGDTAACWTFTSAACKTCMDLGLHVGRGDFWNLEGEDNELYYCFVWCYILDKGFSMNLGRRICLLDTDLIKSTDEEGSFEQSHQSTLIAKLLEQMHDAKENLDGLNQTPTKFRGLYMDSEMHALEFSYYSVMTGIRRSERVSMGGKTSVGENCLEAARSAIASLRSLQKSQPVGNEGTRLSFVNWWDSDTEH